MRKLIAILGAVGLVAGVAGAEQKTQAELSDAVYDIQRGKDSVNQIDTLRVKNNGTVGGTLTVTGALTASGGVSGSGASLTALPAAQLTGNVAGAQLTNAVNTLTGTLVTNTCVAADGKTNTYVFVPFGDKYLVKSITTSP